ncbi:MAG: right-handed parallel beta-helix repeat-containing protein [Chloroflexota bacterium]|nr:right-handed parallel beta-helix repeat-containing protein [Chloroflexota bacterium]
MWLVAGLVALGLLLGMGLGPLERGAMAAPSLSLSPSSGTPGGAATVKGAGFPWETKGRLVWPDGKVLREFRTTRRGRVSVNLVIPNAPPGAYIVTARAGGESARATFTVTETDESGLTYFLDSANGNDAGSGTSAAQAWKTLDKANQAPLAPGDRLLLKRGGRWLGSLKVARSGTSERRIVIGSYGTGPLPIIEKGSSCVVLSGSHLVLRDIHADDCSWAGVQIQGMTDLVENSLITHNAVGIHVPVGAGDNRILNNELRDNNRMSVLTRSPIDDDSGAFGVLLQGNGTEVASNTISGSDAFSYDYGRDGAAIEVCGGKNNHIHHNLAVDNDAFTELGNSRSSDNTYAYNVVRSSLTSSTFLVTRGAESGYGPVLRTRLFNNTVRLTGSDSQGFVCHAGCGPDILTMRNNIIQAVWKVGYADAPFDEDYNLFDGGELQATKGDHSLVTAPLFVDPARNNVHLRASSPAIDRGIDIGYPRDFDGATVPTHGSSDRPVAPDMGAFEYQP